MNNYDKIDKSFLEKFNGLTFYRNYNELHNSISNEIANILSANIRITGNITDLPTTDYNPYAYGTRDLQSISYIREVRDEFIKHCRQQILRLEPRISSCEIINISLDRAKQFVKFDITCTIKPLEELFTTTVTLKT